MADYRISFILAVSGITLVAIGLKGIVKVVKRRKK